MWTCWLHYYGTPKNHTTFPWLQLPQKVTTLRCGRSTIRKTNDTYPHLQLITWANIVKRSVTIMCTNSLALHDHMYVSRIPNSNSRSCMMSPFLSIYTIRHNNDYRATVSVNFLLTRPAHQATIVSWHRNNKQHYYYTKMRPNMPQQCCSLSTYSVHHIYHGEHFIHYGKPTLLALSV